MKALLVDDDDDMRFLMKRVFQRAGSDQLDTAAGGEEALGMLRSGGLPDVLILDQNMPGMNGIQVLARVRELYPDLPVLFSSGLPGLETRTELRQPKVALISKPFTLAEIRAKLALMAQDPG